MPDQPLTVAELERLVANLESRPPWEDWWQSQLLRVCRHALALHRQVEALTSLSETDADSLLARWDRTEPAIQRGIVARFAGLLTEARDENKRLRRHKDSPRRVCLVGSTRFRKAYESAFRSEEHAGQVCLTVPCYKDDPCCKTGEEQARLDALHLAKIDLADEVLVINVGGYIGDSTRREIAYALAQGKPVRYLESAQRYEVREDDGETA